MLQNLIVLGLTKVCEMLADPFGTDHADLAVKEFVVSALTASKKIVKLSNDHHHLRRVGEVSKTKRLERHEKDLEIQGTFGLLEQVMNGAAHRQGQGFRERMEQAYSQVHTHATPDSQTTHTQGKSTHLGTTGPSSADNRVAVSPRSSAARRPHDHVHAHVHAGQAGQRTPLSTAKQSSPHRLPPVQKDKEPRSG